jgi:hypothetical protein
MLWRLGRSSPDPGLGAGIELRRGDVPGLVDIYRVRKVLPRQRISSKEPPPVNHGCQVGIFTV